MTLKDRLILIADLAYRLRQVDGSPGAMYDASKTLKIGQALDAEIKALHDKLGMTYNKNPEVRKRERFQLQATTSFPEGAPQRESYDNDDALFRAEKRYTAEWRREFECPGCDDAGCPQCGGGLGRTS